MLQFRSVHLEKYETMGGSEDPEMPSKVLSQGAASRCFKRDCYHSARMSFWQLRMLSNTVNCNPMEPDFILRWPRCYLKLFWNKPGHNPIIMDSIGSILKNSTRPIIDFSLLCLLCHRGFFSIAPNSFHSLQLWHQKTKEYGCSLNLTAELLWPKEILRLSQFKDSHSSF